MIYDDSRKETFVKCLKSPISETAGRRALKTKFSPPPGPPRACVEKKYCLGFDPVLGLTCLGFDLSWV